jgi:hypothetical protein
VTLFPEALAALCALCFLAGILARDLAGWIGARRARVLHAVEREPGVFFPEQRLKRVK